MSPKPPCEEDPASLSLSTHLGIKQVLHKCQLADIFFLTLSICPSSILLILLFLTLCIHLLLFICRECSCTTVYIWRSNNKLRESLLSLHHVIKHRSSCLAARAFTHRPSGHLADPSLFEKAAASRRPGPEAIIC